MRARPASLGDVRPATWKSGGSRLVGAGLRPSLSILPLRASEQVHVSRTNGAKPVAHSMSHQKALEPFLVRHRRGGLSRFALTNAHGVLEARAAAPNLKTDQDRGHGVHPRCELTPKVGRDRGSNDQVHREAKARCRSCLGEGLGRAQGDGRGPRRQCWFLPRGLGGAIPSQSREPPESSLRHLDQVLTTTIL